MAFGLSYKPIQETIVKDGEVYHYNSTYAPYFETRKEAENALRYSQKKHWIGKAVIIEGEGGLYLIYSV